MLGTDRYAEMANGKMVLTAEFAQALARSGFPPPAAIEIAPDRGYARDSAPDQEWVSTEALNKCYARLLGGANNPANLDQTFAGVTPLSGDSPRSCGANPRKG